MCQLLDALTYKIRVLYTDTSSEHIGQGQVSRSCGQGQGHMSVTIYTFMGGLFLTEAQPCG